MGRGKHCSVEQRNLILKLRKDRKSYKQTPDIRSCFAKIVPNAIKYRTKPEQVDIKRKTTVYDDPKPKPSTSAKQIKNLLNLPVSDITVRVRR